MRCGLIACTLLALAAVQPASADHHFMKVVEVFAGSPAAPTAQYVVLQAYSANQNALDGHDVDFYDDAGAFTSEIALDQDVVGTASQMKILIANPTAQSYFQITADFAMANPIDPAGSKLCFEPDTPVDCVGWGDYQTSDPTVGNPFSPSLGIQLGIAMVRRLEISGGTTTLQDADDTDDCENDFVGGSPLPKNNAGTTGAVDPDWVFAHDFENGSTSGWGGP